MRRIRCTGKLRKEMGLKKGDSSDSTDPGTGLGDWHANLFHINRRKCILFVNDRTLFNFVALDVRRPQVREISALFLAHLQCVVAEEGLGHELEERILEEYAVIGYAPTNNRSVLGSMNDLCWHYQYLIMEIGGVHSAEVPSIIHRLNRMPMGAIGYQYAVEALKEVYTTVLESSTPISGVKKVIQGTLGVKRPGAFPGARFLNDPSS